MNKAESAHLPSWLRLTLIPGIGGETQRKLLKAFGSPEAVFSASRQALRELISEKNIALLLETENSKAIATALQWVQGDHLHIVTLADAEYPQALLQIPDPPTLLYVRGRLELLNRRALAVVGSRSPTPQGDQNAERFGRALSESGLTIVSGLALGIDAAAHRGALAGSKDTIAFIGTGIDRIYPARNHELALSIGTEGAIVSEFPLATPVMASNFPRRNRLISGLSLGVLVVEAATESGSLITARLANEQGREVFSIPGSIHSPQSRGCHQLIKQGAKLVETAQDILEELNGAMAQPIAPLSTNSPVSVEEAALIDALGFDPCSLDELAARCQQSAEALIAQLLLLELGGKIASLPGGRYQRL